jgi:hypothetical protein
MSRSKTPETENPPRRDGTESGPLGEEIPKNETCILVRRHDEG